MTEQAWKQHDDGRRHCSETPRFKERGHPDSLKPDGDAAGSAAAIARTLERVGAATQTWFVGPLPASAAEHRADGPHGGVRARAFPSRHGWPPGNSPARVRLSRPMRW